MTRTSRAGSLTLVAFGLRIRVDTRPAIPAARLLPYLPPGQPDGRGRPLHRRYAIVRHASGYELSADGAMLARFSRLSHALAYLEGNAKVFLAGRLRRRVMIHAGVVTWRGAAIVLPGASGAGKTSLVIELVRLGARYYSDEFAMVDAGGRVFPYARPLCVRRRPGSLAVKVPWQSLVSGLRAQRPPHRGVPVALVVLTRYRPGATFRPRAVPPGAALLSILEHTFRTREDPHRIISALVSMVRGARVLSGTRGEVSEAARAILAGLE